MAIYTLYTLYNYFTGEAIRKATAEEAMASGQAACFDGGRGVILVDEGLCYVAP
jgi:hypothetical protein